jgi:hypothetical protein
MSKSGSSSDVHQAIDRAIGRIRAYGIDGPRPIEEIEAVLQHGDAMGPALAAAIEAADSKRLAAAIHLGASLKSCEALPAIEAAAFEAAASLEAKSEAIAAYEACGQEPPGRMAEQLRVARGFLAAPSSDAVEIVLSWPPAWRSPVLETWLGGADAGQVELVAGLLGRETDLDSDLLEWLGSQSAERAVEVVQEYMSIAEDRDRVKDAKRALHRLKSKGLEVSEATDTEQDVAFSMAVESSSADRAQAYITSVDGQGSRLLWVLWPSMSGGNRLLQAVVEEAGGLMKADLIAVSRNEFRAHLERLRSNPALLVGRIDVQDAARELVSAAVKSAEQGVALPAAYQEWIEMAGASGVNVDANAEVGPAPIYERIIEAEVDGRGDLIDAAIELLREPYFSSWAVIGEDVDRAVEEIREAERSTLMIDEEQRQARMQDAMRGAVEASFNDETRALYRRRLEAMAGMLWDESGEDAARQALAAAVGFTSVADLFAHHSFARALVHRGVWLIYQEKARKDAAEEKKTGVVRP